MSLSPSGFSKVFHHIEYVSRFLKTYSKLFEWPNLPNLKMIDVGTGSGQILLSIEPVLPSNYEEIVAVDKNIEMVNYFNSVPKDSRISCRLLDIGTTKLPDDLKGRFDFGMSSYCFTYVQNCREAFKNSRDILKPNGELLYFWCIIGQYYDVYKTLNQIAKWAPYTNDFENWKSYFDNDDPIGTLEDELNRVNLKILKTELLDDVIFEGKDLQYFIDAFSFLDVVSNRIPKCDLPKYRNEFSKLILRYLYVDDNAEGEKRAKCPFPTIIFAARKS